LDQKLFNLRCFCCLLLWTAHSQVVHGIKKSSPEGLDIILLYLNELFSKYTLQGLLDELDVIECFTEPGKTPIQGEVLKKQEDLYTAMDVAPLYAKPSVETPGI